MKMATISDKTIVHEMLKNEGRYETDPPAARIYSYYSGQDKTYAVFYALAHDDLQGRDTRFCRKVTLLMTLGVLTLEGRKEIA